ncbi:MAG: DUF11 domain-containing protein [Polyangiaceae bacterium]|nr:DUF11 domain-containing protein [Polyangiaceae bacterium]
MKRPLRALTAGALGLAALGLASPGPASAAQLRFTTTAPGGIVATGNTLGLSKEMNLNGPGIRDSIGTFLSLDGATDDNPANPANPWPAGTTYDWHQNGSAAVLDLPDEFEVLYAELIWGGSYNYVENVTANLDDAIDLRSDGAAMSVTPADITKVTLAETAASGFAVNYYMRSADVTAFVQAHGAGTYEVRGVPATQIETINSLNAAGWTLVVAYRDASQPIRNLSVFVGGSFVDEDTQQDYVVSGFCAPPSGPVGGKVAFSTIEGDANLTGDQLLIAPTVAGPFQNLSGPNNPSDNFFCSQLNDSNGVLDTSGTFGTENHDAVAGANVAGGRQGWDVTAVPLSSADGQLAPGQTSAVMRTITTGDSFVPTLAAFQIDVNAPDFSAGSALQTSTDVVSLGDTLTVTVTLDNQGQAAATGVRLELPLEAGLSLAGFTTDGVPGDAQGNAVTAADLAAGVDEGSLAPGEHRTVVLDLDVVGPPAGNSYILHSTWSYDFVTCQNQPPLSETHSGFAFVSYDGDPTGSGGAGGAGGNGSGAGGNGSGAGGGADGGGGTGASSAIPGGDAGDDGGCGCELPGRRGDASLPGAGAAALLLALAAAGRRARRRLG